MKTVEEELSLGALIREHRLELRGIAENARFDSARAAEIDGIFMRANTALARAGSGIEAAEIFGDAREAIDDIASHDRIERETERRAAIEVVDEARLFEHRRAHRIAWVERISADTRMSISLLRERINLAETKLLSVTTEAELREIFGELADASASLKSALAIQARDSIARKAEVARLAAL